jgi:hypothetical protein
MFDAAWRDRTRGAIFSLSLVVVLGLIALYQTVV